MASIKLNVDFEKMLEKIKAANGDIDKTVKRVADECAKVMHDELASECSASGVPSSVSGEIKHEVNVTAGGNVYEVKAGWKMGEYNPQNPSAGYKAVFLNYGTARRSTKKPRMHQSLGGEWVTLGTDRGSIAARGFIARAKKNAGKRIKKVQKEALQKMLEELK